MTEKGQPVVRSDFLDLVSIKLQQEDDLGRKRDWSMELDQSATGVFVQSVGETLAPGRHTFRIMADGRTFKRQIEKTLVVIENVVTANVAVAPKADPQQITISLTPDPENQSGLQVDRKRPTCSPL